MSSRMLRRATTLACVLALAVAGSASADSLRADGDVTTALPESTVPLGPVGPGATLEVPVGFLLTCGDLSHADPGQTVTLAAGARTEPGDGLILSATDGSVGPVPAAWPADGEGCPTPAPSLSGTPSLVTIQAPTTDGIHTFTLFYDRTLAPGGVLDASALRSATAVTFEVEVVSNTPPVLVLPDVAGSTVEGDTAGGWLADWSGLGSTDAEDDPDPAPSCVPDEGTILALGTTSVDCAVIDLGGLETGGSFEVTVVDTTAPSLPALADLAVVTSDPGGTVLAYDAPTASDVVDPAPAVSCLPAAGTVIPLGTTTVTCTARDASGNAATETFVVAVAHVPPVVAVASWGEPIGAGSTFLANRGRTIPVKVGFSVDGVPRANGEVLLTVVPCGDGQATTVPMTASGGRWDAALDTSRLAGSCHVVTAWIDGLDGGSFHLELRGTEAVRAQAGKR